MHFLHSVVEAKTDVAATHPLAPVLDLEGSFRARVSALARRLTLLFRALDARDIVRVEHGHEGNGGHGQLIEPVGITHVGQRRTFPPGYARAFFTPSHVAEQLESQGKDPAKESVFWDELDARYAAARPQDLAGTERWAVLHFRRRPLVRRL